VIPSKMQILTTLDMAMFSEAAEVNGTKCRSKVWMTLTERLHDPYDHVIYTMTTHVMTRMESKIQKLRASDIDRHAVTYKVGFTLQEP
jgi:hypothetical protein